MRLLAAFLAVVVLAAPAFARSAPAPEPTPQPAFDAVGIGLTMIQADEPNVREEGVRRLIPHADIAADRLRDLAAKSDNADLKKAIARVLQFAGGGEVVDGLRIRLEVDKTALRPGDKVNITTTLMNLTDKPMQLEVGYTTTGNYFESGSALTGSFTTGATGASAATRPQWTVGMCGTGAHAIVKTIEPMSTLTYTTPATFGEVNSQFGRVAAPAKPGEPAAPKPTGLILGKSKYSYIPLSANGTLTLNINRQNRDIRPKPQPKVVAPKPVEGPEGIVQIQPAPVLINPGFPQPKIDANKPFWHGPMKSNPIELKVFTKQIG